MMMMMITVITAAVLCLRWCCVFYSFLECDNFFDIKSNVTILTLPLFDRYFILSTREEIIVALTLNIQQAKGLTHCEHHCLLVVFFLSIFSCKG